LIKNTFYFFFTVIIIILLRKEKLLVFVFTAQWDIFAAAVGKIFEDLKAKPNLKNTCDV